MTRLIDLLALILSGIYLRILLDFFNQKWIQSISQTSTLVILPVITYIITSIITGNIALSLGMVGALSIVRFRTPIRSPLELTIYFAAITMGIAASTELKWLIYLDISIFLCFITIFSIDYFRRRISGKRFFNVSFNDGNLYSSLEITCKEKIDFVEDSKFLKSKIYSKESIKYILLSDDYKLLKNIAVKLDGFEGLEEYQLNE